MKNAARVSLAAAAILLTTGSSSALDLKQAKFTQVVHEVRVISGVDQSIRPAVVDTLFGTPDVLRTGSDSRAELVAADHTITRVGANTIFSFEPVGRTIHLKQGSLLFHSPKGKGGGTIQTGSATAAVLGTTIAVTTTPDGGFKLLVLEGFAEVKFLNGLRQHLSAGQMTFILPGGGMSPIIVFRLDANAKASQLVSGFDNPLPSMNRISDAINRQTQLIQQGRAQDTGLIVGDKASPSQVEAIDPNIAQNYLTQQTSSPPPPTPEPTVPVIVGNSYETEDGLLVRPSNVNEPLKDALAPAVALSTDQTIDSATLDSKYTFLSTGPYSVTSRNDEECNSLFQNPFSGVFARNLTIATATLDLATFGALTQFDFLAAQNILLAGSLDISGIEPSIRLIAGGRIQIAPHSTLTASASLLSLASCGSMQLHRVTLQNLLGSLSVVSLRNLYFRDSVIAATTSPPGSPPVMNQNVQLSAGRNLSVFGTTLTGDSVTAEAGRSITFTRGARLNAGMVTLTAGDGIVLDNVSMTGDSLHLTARNDIRVRGGEHSVDLSSLTDLNISGRTLVFENVNFGGSPVLQSELGLLADNPNTRQRILRGYVNFFSGVTYQGTLITSANQSTYVNPASGPGILVTHR